MTRSIQNYSTWKELGKYDFVLGKKTQEINSEMTQKFELASTQAFVLATTVNMLNQLLVFSLA